MKKLIPGVIALAVLSGAALLTEAYRSITTPVPREVALIFNVDSGMTLSEVAGGLEDHGVVRHAILFELLARYRGVEHGINAGRYEIEAYMDPGQILSMLTEGRIAANRVNVPEGLTIPETARTLRAKIGIDSTAFVHRSADPDVVRSLGIDASTLEGYLYPATYNMYPDMTVDDILKQMTSRYLQTITAEYRTRAEELGYSIHEIVTLASIIEQEAMVDDERDVISGVFHNRLRMGIRLEADPTVQYGIGRPNMRLYRKHLSDPSPYNTYVHDGLPPGPICSPGKASIHAALYPRDVPYLFFVARGDGTHIFSTTNREHNRARALVKSRRARP
ncbi:MAG: endolytic transglycosylase MltG [Gemmatimonadetes bacterium]|nr:endolytic transglycosylase MltG [Gemmatimonadota bacterium]